MRLVDTRLDHWTTQWIFEHKGKRYCTPCFTEKHTYGDAWKAIDELREYITMKEREPEIREYMRLLKGHE